MGIPTCDPRWKQGFLEPHRVSALLKRAHDGAQEIRAVAETLLAAAQKEPDRKIQRTFEENAQECKAAAMAVLNAIQTMASL